MRSFQPLHAHFITVVCLFASLIGCYDDVHQGSRRETERRPNPRIEEAGSEIGGTQSIAGDMNPDLCEGLSIQDCHAGEEAGHEAGEEGGHEAGEEGGENNGENLGSDAQDGLESDLGPI